jgi:nitrogen fixation/metabolism regulation signal transduction histidine kinase
VWSEYRASCERFFAAAAGPELQSLYFAGLRPQYTALREAADAILAMNQDAIVRKSEQARQTAERSVTLLLVFSLLGLVVALYAAVAITSRLLRPLAVLGQAARRLGEGDLAVRAQIEGADEIAGLAADFNVMAEHLQRYRESTLGELLRAQRAARLASARPTAPSATGSRARATDRRLPWPRRRPPT